MNDHVLKHLPGDFLVREVLVPQLTEDASASHQYAVLSKAGFTTMEAVRIVAAELNLGTEMVTYAGLKDEDGLTEQLVAFPRGHLHSGEWDHQDGAGRKLRLRASGFGFEPLTIGGLEGNAFRLVVRNIAPALADQLCDRRKLNHFFLNYYDIQRFGVPGGPRRTHLVGAGILDGRWDDALRELVGLAAPESAAAATWDGSAEQFFLNLDSRTTSFYLAAAASWEWNGHLRRLIGSLGADEEIVDVEVEGLAYRYAASSRLVCRVLADNPDLPYRRYTFVNGRVSFVESSRPTVIQTQIAIANCAADEHYLGRSRLEFRFFLPSGCYATAAIRQLLTQVEPAARAAPSVV